MVEKKGQRHKIIVEIVVNMSTVSRIEFSCNLKSSSYTVGYYSYTNGSLK